MIFIGIGDIVGLLLTPILVTFMPQRLATPSQTGQVLSARRKALKLSQRVLAERVGISQNRLSELEMDPSRLTLDRLLFLVNALGLELVLQDKDRSGSVRQSEW